MKVEAFIPARYASTRLDGKALADIGGKPMVEWVYARTLKAGLVSEVTVATDDERIKEAVESFGGRVVMTSSEHRSGTDRIAEAAKNSDADIIVNVQGDEPLIEPEMIDACVRPLIDDPGLKLSTLKTLITEHEEFLNPHAVKVVTDIDGYAMYFSRAPIPYPIDKWEEGAESHFKHLGLYAYRHDFLNEFASLEQTGLERTERLEQLRALENGIRIRVVETPFSPIGVDTEKDLAEVRRLVKEGGTAL